MHVCVQARKEAIQIRIKERLNATLLKNKDLGYAGLETCDHSHVRPKLLLVHNSMCPVQNGSDIGHQYKTCACPPVAAYAGPPRLVHPESNQVPEMQLLYHRACVYTGRQLHA